MRKQVKTLDRGTTYREQYFESLAEFKAHIDSAPINAFFKAEYGTLERSNAVTNSNRFAGVSFADAGRLFENGWVSGAEKLAIAIKPSTATAETTRYKPTYNVVGGAASVPRYLQGLPTAMIDRKQEKQKQKVITVNRDIAYSAAVEDSQIMEEGIKALKIVRALEGKGYRVKLVVNWITERDGEALGCRIVVKKPEERFSLSKVAFPLAHTAMLRRLGFRWLEVNEDATKDFTHGYGRPAGAYLHQVVGKGEIVLPSFLGSEDEAEYLKNLGL